MNGETILAALGIFGHLLTHHALALYLILDISQNYLLTNLNKGYLRFSYASLDGEHRRGNETVGKISGKVRLTERNPKSKTRNPKGYWDHSVKGRS